MASIVKRKNKYAVVYSYKDEQAISVKNGRHLIPMRKRKRESLKLSLNCKTVHSSYLRQGR